MSHTIDIEKQAIHDTSSIVDFGDSMKGSAEVEQYSVLKDPQNVEKAVDIDNDLTGKTDKDVALFEIADSEDEENSDDEFLDEKKGRNEEEEVTKVDSQMLGDLDAELADTKSGSDAKHDFSVTDLEGINSQLSKLEGSEESIEDPKTEQGEYVETNEGTRETVETVETVETEFPELAAETETETAVHNQENSNDIQKDGEEKQAFEAEGTDFEEDRESQKELNEANSESKEIAITTNVSLLTPKEEPVQVVEIPSHTSKIEKEEENANINNKGENISETAVNSDVNMKEDNLSEFDESCRPGILKNVVESGVNLDTTSSISKETHKVDGLADEVVKGVQFSQTPTNDSNIIKGVDKPLPSLPQQLKSLNTEEESNLQPESLKPKYKYFKNLKKMEKLSKTTSDYIFALAVVDFDHIKGPELTNWIDTAVITEYSANGFESSRKIEKEKVEKYSKIWPYLPFQALPDGVHMFDETFTQFTLCYDELNKSSVNLTPDEIVLADEDDENTDRDHRVAAHDESAHGSEFSVDGNASRDEHERLVVEIEDPNEGVVTLFGCACIRQIEASLLTEQESDTKRSIVQKSVILITRSPLPIQIKEKLSIITQSWFEQCNFTDYEILHALFSNLSTTYNENGYSLEDDDLYERDNEQDVGQNPVKIIKESDIYMGLNFQENILKLRKNLLVLLKCLIIGEYRILFFSKNLNELSNIQYTLIGLLSNSILNLSDSGFPLCDKNMNLKRAKCQSLKSSDRSSILKFLGLPLNIFGFNSFFQPYLTLQELSYITNPNSKSFVIGSSNDIILENKNDWFDLVVYLDEKDHSIFGHSNGCRIEILNKSLKDVTSLTWYDKKFMEFVIHSVECYKTEYMQQHEEPQTISDDTDGTLDGKSKTRSKTINCNDSINNGNYKGGDDFIRSQFEDYLIGFLSCVKYDSFLSSKDPEFLEKLNLNYFENDATKFNSKFINKFRETKIFKEWNECTEDELFNFFEPKHVFKDIAKKENSNENGKSSELFKGWINKWKERKPANGVRNENDPDPDPDANKPLPDLDEEIDLSNEGGSHDSNRESVNTLKTAVDSFGQNFGSFFQNLGETGATPSDTDTTEAAASHSDVPIDQSADKDIRTPPTNPVMNRLKGFFQRRQ